jgi:hypothetical protein
VKGAAKIAKVMGEFKARHTAQRLQERPEVTNPKQAVAISLSEARKAGAKVPMKKAEGGAVARGNRVVGRRGRRGQGNRPPPRAADGAGLPPLSQLRQPRGEARALRTVDPPDQARSCGRAAR